MDLTRKIHSNSILKNLPEEKQTEILGQVKNLRSYKKTSEWLVAAGIDASAELVREFRQWHTERKKLRDKVQASDAMAHECKLLGWVETAEEERAAAQAFFNRMVVDEGDPKLWAMVERVNIYKDKADLEAKRLKLEQKKHRDKTAAKRVKKSKLSPEEKQQRIRQILGTE